MRAKTMLAAAVLGALGALIPATPASACIQVYVPVIGSTCNACPWLHQQTGVTCPF